MLRSLVLSVLISGLLPAFAHAATSGAPVNQKLRDLNEMRIQELPDEAVRSNLQNGLNEIGLSDEDVNNLTNILLDFRNAGFTAEEIILHYMGSPSVAPIEVGFCNVECYRDRWLRLNGTCRGGSSGEIELICDWRDNVVGPWLYRNGLCYGKEGQVGADMEWHICGPGSMRG